MPDHSVRTKVTPPQLARRYGVSPDKILMMIRAGYLEAIDIASPGSSRPRWLIDERDIEAFEERRKLYVQPKQRIRRNRNTNVTEYF